MEKDIGVSKNFIISYDELLKKKEKYHLDNKEVISIIKNQNELITSEKDKLSKTISLIHKEESEIKKKLKSGLGDKNLLKKELKEHRTLLKKANKFIDILNCMDESNKIINRIATNLVKGKKEFRDIEKFVVYMSIERDHFKNIIRLIEGKKLEHVAHVGPHSTKEKIIIAVLVILFFSFLYSTQNKAGVTVILILLLLYLFYRSFLKK